jgi:hypothetical protein
MRERRHSASIAERWFTFPLVEQMGNVGSEVSRALNWRSRNPEIANRALDRALELIDLTLDDPRHRVSVARLREICRVRELLLDYLVGPNQYGSTEKAWLRYFDAFGVAAVKGRARARTPAGP